MKIKLGFLLTVFLMNASAFASDLGSNILVRYSNFYQGDDDAFGTCLILEDSKALIWIDGLVPNSVQTLSIPNAKFQALQRELKKLPSDTKGRTENVYPEKYQQGMVASNFISAKHGYPGYVKVDEGSTLTSVVKSICDMEEKN